MNAHFIETQLLEWTVANSGHESGRYANYLGMSQIHRDEEELIAMLKGQDWKPTEQDHLRLRCGHIFETEMLLRLDDCGLVTDECMQSDWNNEVIADFDDRFRGHIDAVLIDGSLVEIKSTFQNKLDKIIEGRMLPREVYQQVQMYMHHGKFPRCFVVYIARDTGQLYVKEVRPNRHLIQELNNKAYRVLKAVPAMAA